MANDVRIRLAIDGTAEVANGIDRVGSNLGTMETRAKAAAVGADTLKSALGALAGTATIYALVKMADAVTTLNTQLRLSSNTAGEATKAYGALFEIAQKSRVSFTELGTTYAAIARSGKELGVSQDRLLTVTQSISQAMTIGGGSAASMQAALVQLGQGLSSGTLRGEELNSIMEQTPRLAKAIADGLGVPIGELRKLGEAGALTSEQIITALEKSGPQLAKEMASATLTVGQAFTMLTNSATNFIGTADSASGASGTLAGALQSVSSGIDTVGAAIKAHETAFAVITGGLAGAATVGGIAALGFGIKALIPPVIALGVAMAANPVILALAGIAAVAVGLKVAADSAAKSQTGMGYAIADLDAKIARSEATRESSTAAGFKRLTEMRTERARLQGELALLSSQGLSNPAEDARLARSASALAGLEKTRTAYGAIAQDLSGVNASFQVHLSQLKAGFDAGIVTQAQYVQDVAALIKKEGGVHKDAGAAIKSHGDAYADVRTAAQSWEAVMAQAGKLANKTTSDMQDLTKGQALLRDYMASTAYTINEKTNPAMNAMVKNLLDGVIANEKMEAGQKLSAKAFAEVTKEYEKYVDGLAKSAATVADHVQKLQDEEKASSIAVAQNISLAQAIELVTIARLEESQAKAYANGDQEAGDAIKLEIENRKKLATLINGKDFREANAKSAKDAAEEWKKTAEKINDSITDALMRGFENGKGFAENLRDTITNMFKTMILRPIVSAVVSPISQGFSSMLGGAGATSMGSNSLINGANTASSLSSFGGAAAQYWTGSSAGASSASLAYANGVGMVGGDSIGALASANGGWSGVSASGGSAASGAAAGGSSASSMIPIIGWIIAGMTASSSMYDQGHRWDGKYNALEPVMGATDGVLQGIGLDGKTAAIVSGSALIQGVLDKVGSWFDGGHEYTVGTGVQGKFSNGGFSGRNYQQWQNDGSPGIFGIGKTSGSSGTNYSAMGSAASNALGDAFVRVTDQVSGFAKSLGLSTDTIKGFSKDITVALGSDAAANKAAIDAMFTGIADDMSAAFLGTYETTVTKATGLLGSFLPDVVSKVFKPGALMKEGETASVTLVRLSTSLGQVNNSFDVLDKELLSLSLTSGDSASKLVDLLGGMDAFKATTSSYYEAFYTEGERNAKLLEQLTGSFDKMGVALPDSLQTYRDLVNAQDVNTESGRAMYASLMGMSGAFAQVTKAADAAANSVLSTLAYSNYVDYASAASASGMKALPRFAAGGMHAGGLRLVGENGPEVEATGPARIWNADQMAGALRGGPAAPTSDAAAAEIRAQREEARAQARTMATLYSKMLQLFDQWDKNGMPEVRTV